MKRATLVLALVALALLIGVGQAQAGMLTVTSYDIDHGRPSGFGGWFNTYTGTITANGNGTVQYSGGSGTLNDGVLPTSNLNSQLYQFSDNSVTTLHLGSGLSTVTTIDLFGFNNFNSIPGDIDTVAVTINGITADITATGFGPTGPEGLPVNEELDLSSTSLASLPTNAVSLQVLSLKGGGAGTGDYQIGEAEAFGSPADATAAPEPASLTLLGLGGLCLGGCAWRRRKAARPAA
jgi:hypothetical protein